MPASLETNKQVIQGLGERESALFFPVSLQPLNTFLMEGANDANDKWHALTNDQSGEIIAIHKDKYRLQTNRDVFGEFDKALAHSPLDLTGLVVTDELAYQGGRAVRTYRMPAHRVDIGGGDFVDLMLKVQNSYDGSRRFGMSFGAFRVLCSNGLVIGNTMMEVKAKHTTGLDISAVTGQLHNAIEAFAQVQGQWAQWRDTPCPDGIPESVISSLPGTSEALRDRILDDYHQEAATHGKNIWVLFNALTYWSTHEEVKESARANISAIVLSREAKVRRALSHPAFGISA